MSMEQLRKIQKTFHVFEVLTKIGYILSIVGAVVCAVGALCAVAWYNGGQVFSLFGDPITPFSTGRAMNEMLAVLLSDFVMITSEAILLSFACRYLKAEQAHGTPFTETGAEMLKKLGIRCIWLPIVAITVACVIGVCLGAEDAGDFSNLPSVATGIVLILASMIFRYGAALEETCKC
ncbi:MAG: hypothetical protein MSS60_00835 [Clostridiales bacterium]|nr:hypothetical protein [Clostridiales bacterium]